MNQGFCEKCGQYRLLQEHHIIPRCEGGSDDSSNIMLLCYDCHWAIHNSFEFKWGVEFLDVWIPPTFEQIKRDLEMWGLDYILSQIPQEKIAEYKQYRQARMVD